MAPIAADTGAVHPEAEESAVGSWSRAHRLFVFMSDSASGVDCGGEADGKKVDNARQKARAVMSQQSSSCPVIATQPGTPSGTMQGSQSSCPVISQSGEQLHPLTHMPLALYSDEQQSAGIASAAVSQPDQGSRAESGRQQRPRARWLSWGKSQPDQQGTTAAAAPVAADSAEHQLQMPQQPAVDAGPLTGLGANRQRSSIPMAEPLPDAQLPPHQQNVATAPTGERVWMYPSEQMFYNAMKRKGWDPNAQDMGTVVAIHNAVNERAWQEVCAWEALHCADCPSGPRLARFQGRPADLSPKARFLNLLGYAPPFDRHDWVVDRCGRQVRYVIDFYAGVPRPGGPPAAMWLDTRPALDSFDAAWDRLYMAARWMVNSMWYSDTRSSLPSSQSMHSPPGASGATAQG